MIRRSDGKIGKREFASLIVLTVGLKFSDTTPTLLMHKGGHAAWLMPFFSFAIMSISFLVLLSVLKRHEKQGLMELIQELTGKYGQFVIGMILFSLTLISTILNSRSYVDILNTMVYQRTPIPVLYVMLMLATFYIAKRGLETIGRVSWIVVPYIEIFFVLLVVFVRQNLDWLHLAPIAGPGIKQVIKESTLYSTIFWEMILITAFVPFARTFKDFRTASFWGFGLSCIKIIVMVAVYIAVFDYPAAKNMAYPYQQLTRAASFGQIITHLDSIFLAFWLVSTFIHFAIYVYILTFLFARSLRIKEFEPLILPFSGLILLTGLIPENIFSVNQFRELMIRSLTVIYTGLPFLLWGLDRWKRRVRH